MLAISVKSSFVPPFAYCAVTPQHRAWNEKQWRIQDLTLGGRGLCQRGEGGRKSLKVLTVGVKVKLLLCFGHKFYLKYT